MRLLFVHGEEKLKEDVEGNYYTDGSYTQNVWNRYLSLFEDICVMFRKDPINYDSELAMKKFQYFDKNRIKYKKIPDLYSSILDYINLNNRKKIANLFEEALKENDCLIVRLPSKEGNMAIKYAKKYNKPYLIEVVGCPWDAFWNHSYKGKFIALSRYFAMKKVLKNAPYVLYVTNEFLQRRYPSKGKTIGCSDVSLPLIDNDIIKQRIKKIRSLKKDEPIIIGTTGAVNVRYKGQEFVIKAISRLNKEGYNFKYHLVGGGDEDYLKSIAKENNVLDKVKFFGELPHEKVFNYLDSIDLYIQPSKTEGLPRALVEAMSRGCPSFGSRIGGIPELLDNRFIFNSGSVDEICTLLKKIDKKTMIEDASRSFDKAKEFDKATLDEKRLEFYKQFSEMCRIVKS